MKASIMVFHLILLVICCQTTSQAGAAVVTSSCCTNYVRKTIPRNLVISYRVTNRSACSIPGVIFITKGKREICADPTKQWVKDYMKMIDTNKAKVSMTVRPKALKKSLRTPSSNSTSINS
ncbi:C-C motif chemokine 24 [Gracilinanus agilis]|uniref:C-C motif chemokine 24 n=1 Tax=Gracilinanus agilis TaxID=191870 RepID=UPI001CFEE933|nr:C-C motif chemokine 24 [Gracilinanus agilis]